MCLFCKIAGKQIPSKMVFEDDDLFAFHDINPGAPTHVLVIPKLHLASMNDATPEHQALFGKLMLAGHRAAEIAGIDKSGFRLVINTGADAGQSVHHVHLHVIGGRAMAWPPG
ncbi:MAG: histidine triad nucleotide-binding protein [Byssovorax sp.]